MIFVGMQVTYATRYTNTVNNFLLKIVFSFVLVNRMRIHNILIKFSTLYIVLFNLLTKTLTHPSVVPGFLKLNSECSKEIITVLLKCIIFFPENAFPVYECKMFNLKDTYGFSS